MKGKPPSRPTVWAAFSFAYATGAEDARCARE